MVSFNFISGIIWFVQQYVKGQYCTVLAKSHLGAKRVFEIWAFKVFFLWTPKAPLRMASRGSDLNIKMGQNTQEIHHKA